ncbi:ribosome recycling factor domain-containing protein [Xylariaceae sp. FL0804]|nr:ribosome recycling factor domain-containing protein [Xylariaceae sp. FL0804]
MQVHTMPARTIVRRAASYLELGRSGSSSSSSSSSGGCNHVPRASLLPPITAARTAAGVPSRTRHYHHARPTSRLLLASGRGSGRGSESSSTTTTTTRFLHSTAIAHKKKEKRDGGGRFGGGAIPPSAPPQKDDSGGSGGDDGDGGAKHPVPSPEAPLDFADVKSRVSRAEAHFREQLRQQRSGGRFDAATLEALPVPRRNGNSDSSETYPLREVATVVPGAGGRSVSLLVHEAGSVAGVMSAVQSSPLFNQQPQRASPDNPLELVLRVEADRPADVAARARAACVTWRERVRTARQRRDRLHAAWRKEGVLGPDLKARADKELEKLIKAQLALVDAAEKEATKGVAK